MALRINQDAKNKTLDSGFRSLFAGHVLELRSGPQPDDASFAATGTLLMTKTLPSPCWLAAASGVLVKTGSWDGVSVAVGKIGWFRLKLSTDPGGITQASARLDGIVTLTSLAGELTVDNLTVGVIGQAIAVSGAAVGIFG